MLKELCCFPGQLFGIALGWFSTVLKEPCCFLGQSIGIAFGWFSNVLKELCCFPWQSFHIALGWLVATCAIVFQCFKGTWLFTCVPLEQWFSLHPTTTIEAALALKI